MKDLKRTDNKREGIFKETWEDKILNLPVLLL